MTPILKTDWLFVTAIPTRAWLDSFGTDQPDGAAAAQHASNEMQGPPKTPPRRRKGKVGCLLRALQAVMIRGFVLIMNAWK